MRACEQSYPDSYSRVKVQFHWDRNEARDGTSYRWKSESQYFELAAVVINKFLEVESEVLVGALGGDPDRPIITGQVPNPGNASPGPAAVEIRDPGGLVGLQLGGFVYLPGLSVLSLDTRDATTGGLSFGDGIRGSRPGLKSAGGGANELRFEDRMGEENIYILAPGSSALIVLNDPDRPHATPVRSPFDVYRSMDRQPLVDFSLYPWIY